MAEALREGRKRRIAWSDINATETATFRISPASTKASITACLHSSALLSIGFRAEKAYWKH
jgi:hypothetical protein